MPFAMYHLPRTTHHVPRTTDYLNTWHLPPYRRWQDVGRTLDEQQTLISLWDDVSAEQWGPAWGYYRTHKSYQRVCLSVTCHQPACTSHEDAMPTIKLEPIAKDDKGPCPTPQLGSHDKDEL